MSQDVKEFIFTRDKALAALDMDYARKIMPKASDEVRLISMHMARYEAVKIDPLLREASREWLESRNYHRIGGLPWPSAGTLPE